MKNGGPAFPVLHSIDGNWVKEPLNEFRGMTLRDYFAAAALTGILARDFPDEATGWLSSDQAAELAYIQADAMLAERAE